MAEDPTIEVGGRRVRFTHPDKVLYPSTGTTKAEVVDYYRAVAPWFVAHARGRPATRKRWVDGVGTDDHPGAAFFSKNIDSGTPDWVRTLTLRHRERQVTYPLVDDAATLVWLAQIASLEIHVPQWRAGPRGGHRNPDRLVLDLDPGDGAGLRECVQVALLCKEILDDMGLPPVPVTSGSKGIHLYSPLDGKITIEQATTVAHELAKALETDHPDLVVSRMARDARGGKVFVDWSQNNGSKTTVAPYSLRGRSRPFVAAPRAWEELTDDLQQLQFPQVVERLRTQGDLLAPLLPPETRIDDPAPTDRLAMYRSMRDANRTPEPVPAPSPHHDVGPGHRFVIQEHHASRLHWDFRLEHDGVLVSWALPKGPPDDPKINHLAVMTEDHPLEYGSFEGSIPQGEYGGGDVFIWDAGTYECEKWREGEEVVAVLHGRAGGGLGGVAKFALIHTRQGGQDKNWLIHRMKHDPKTAAQASTESDVSVPHIEPMLATLGSVDDLGDRQWAYETKWDGYRAIAEVSARATVFRSRNGNDISGSYPELQELADLLAGHSAVLDGEIVALDERGRSVFGRLQNRGDPARAVKAHYMAFDLLHLDGKSLLRMPYEQRREALESLSLGGEHVHVPVTFGRDQQLALRTSREMQLEGIVAKTIDGIYQPGARARTWIKIKNVRSQEVIVVGWKPGSAGRSGRIGSLLLAVHDGDRLSYVGKVGTGFSARTLADLQRRLERLSRKTPPLDDVPRAEAKQACWVTPKLVGEVAYAEWTQDGRLRHSSWRGLRPDKSVEEVVRAQG